MIRPKRVSARGVGPNRPFLQSLQASYMGRIIRPDVGDIFELRIIYNFGIAPYHYSRDVVNCFNLLANSLPKIRALRIFYFTII